MEKKRVLGKKRALLRVSAFVVAAIMVGSFIASVFILSKVFSSQAHAGSFQASAAAYTSARAMCTMEVSNGRVLYDHNAQAQLPMASTTKIVTAITVLENCNDIDELVKIDDRAIGIEGTSIYLQKGESLTVRELLLGLMLRSGNDTAGALALHVCPPAKDTPKSQIFDDFSQKMQDVARKAGAVNSSFKNPHGLDEEGHYTTAHDLALITCYALKNPLFAEIVATSDAKISGVEYTRVLHNKNRLLKTMEGCIGVKTGFTKKAGRCYVGAAQEDGIRVVCVVLNCGPMFEEAQSLMAQGLKKCAADKLFAEETWYIDVCEEQESTNTLPSAELPPEEQASNLCETGDCESTQA